MEQKRADVKEGLMATKKSECTEKQHTPQPDNAFHATYLSRDSQTPVAQKLDGPDWLLDSPLGRWLGRKHLAFTNLTLLKVFLWLVLLGLFVELDFGLPFFLISLLYWLYKEGFRKPAARQPGELSAYSVFNPDCQPLLGAVTTEQLEREMGLLYMV